MSAPTAAHGFMVSPCFRIGVGSGVGVQQVREPAGYEGERVTPWPQPQHDASGDYFTIPRSGHVIVATRAEAKRIARQIASKR